MSDEKALPFYSFKIIYNTLIWTGYYKPLKKLENRCTVTVNRIYRLISFLITIVFNLQHLIFIAQRVNKLDEVFDSLMIEIPQLNLLVKHINLNLQSSRIDKINSLITDALFAAKTKKDEEVIEKNNANLRFLCILINIGITLCGPFWTASHFARRYQNEKAVVPIYVPFNTDTWGKYSWSVAMEVFPLLWVGYGHLAIDCLMSAYFAQASVQLKIIKNNLQYLFDSSNVDSRGAAYRYKDVIDPDLRRHFVYYVIRFDKLAWYTKEVNEVFNPAMLFQFITSSLSICMVIYMISRTPILSVPFLFLAVVLCIVSTQVFLYCYFGHLVRYESQTLVDSLYLSDWLSVSPHFRRLLLIAMLRWSRTIAPTVSGVIPVSLNTFVSILRSAYSLCALLVTRQITL